MNLPCPRVSELLTAAILLLATGNSADVRAEAPQQRESLNGTWEFTNDRAIAAGQGEWDKLEVPGNWELRPQYSKHRGEEC